MSYKDASGRFYPDGEYYQGEDGNYYSSGGSGAPIGTPVTPAEGEAAPWLNGFMPRWNQMGSIDPAPLADALQKYGIDPNTFNWQTALDASDIGKNGNRSGFDLYSPERFTQAYLQGLGRVAGIGNAPLNEWMTSTGNTDSKIAQLDAGYADAKGKSDAAAKPDIAGFVTPMAVIGGAALGFGALTGALGAGAGAAGAGWVSAEGGAAYAGGLAADAAVGSTGAGLIGGANGIETGLTTTGGIQSANTGGMLVGSNGVLGSTGNAIADAALNSAGQSAIKSTITGGDPLKSGAVGLVTGGFGSLVAPYLPDTGSSVGNAAVSGAVSGAVGAGVTGGDIGTGALIGAGAGAAGSAVGGTVAGLTGSGVAGGIAGSVAGTVAGGLINGALAPDGSSTAVPPASVTPPTVTPTPSGSLGFSSVLPQFQDVSRRDMGWGARLSSMGVPA